MSEPADALIWPALPLAEWRETRDTLHMWTQVVGKVRLALTPLINHWWNVALYVTARGLTTSEIPYRGQWFDMELDFDADSAQRFWRVLALSEKVLTKFRARFIGKCSPVHFFWGSFDLAVTRFSGRRAPPREGADVITGEAYSHEVSSVGWWPGDSRLERPAFYSYAVPEPAGFREAAVRPAATYYHEKLGGFYLHHDDAIAAADPEALLLDFCQTTYEAAANLSRWDRASLER